MSLVTTDIDIDFPDRNQALEGLRHIPAALTNTVGQRLRHPSGVYLQDVPVDPTTGLCSFDYEEAESLGYFKIDFLNNSIYQGVRDEDHLVQLLETDPEWSLLEEEAIVSQLAHINNHYGVVQIIRPRSIEDLAVVLALIRPGKKYLLGRPRGEIDAKVWEPEEDGYTFKKSHSVAFAASIVVQLNLLVERIGAEIDAGGAN